MQKSDLSELKKTLKINKLTISRIAGCYINGEGEKLCQFNKNFLTLDESEQFKYLELLKKLMSCKVGDTLQSLPVADGDHKKMLQSLRVNELKDDSLANVLFDNIISHCSYPNGYSVFLFYSAYDIPAKGTDKLSQGESDEVYSSIYALICPTVISTPCLCFNLGSKSITTSETQKTIGNPDVGFIYPDFNDRSTDLDRVVYGICNKKDILPDFAKDVLGCDKNLTAKQQKEVFEEALKETVTDEEITLVSAVIDSLIEKAEESVKDEHPVIETQEIAKILLNNGLGEEKADTFVETYKELAGTNELQIKNVVDTKKKVYKNPDVTINVSPEKKHLVKTEKRDGKNCLVISLDALIEINGVPCEG